ncbi:MAG TPA: response regulator [Nitrospirota bacterium]|nr:response regulator [Nitrospirota bacterium]
MIVPCECGAKLKIDDAKVGPLGVKIRCPRCGNILPVMRQTGEPAARTEPRQVWPMFATAPLVLIAHDSKVVRDMVASVLEETGFRIDMAADGVEALKKCLETAPDALVLDVGLPGIYGFELCERLRGNQRTAGIKIVLLSSVYDMRRYKRTPVNLYGADDYIEKHHIPDYLPVKLRNLIAPEQEEDAERAGKTKEHVLSELPEMARPPAREFQPSLLAERLMQEDPQPPEVLGLGIPMADTERLEGATVLPESFSLDGSIFQKEECDIPRVDAADPSAVEKAKRFARIIVSDIALYNQEAVIEGLKKGTFYELLKTDVDEGRELYEKRVPEIIRKQKDHYQEAFDNFIRSQKKNVR